METLHRSKRFQIAYTETNLKQVRQIVVKYRRVKAQPLDTFITNTYPGLWPRQIAAIYLRLGVYKKMFNTTSCVQARGYLRMLKDNPVIPTEGEDTD